MAVTPTVDQLAAARRAILSTIRSRSFSETRIVSEEQVEKLITAVANEFAKLENSSDRR